MDSTSKHPVFDRARDVFLSGLSPEDRALYLPCFSAEDVQVAMKKLRVVSNETAGRRGSGEAALSVIHRLGEAFKPYFKVIEIFVSSNPQYAAVV